MCVNHGQTHLWLHTVSPLRRCDKQVMDNRERSDKSMSELQSSQRCEMEEYEYWCIDGGQ